MNEVVETLRVQLTPDERIQRGTALAKLNLELVQLEEQKAEAVRSWAEKIKAKKIEGGRLAHDVDTGTEERPIKCDERPRFGELVVEVVRRDTGEVVRTRPMLPEERQVPLSIVRDRDEKGTKH